MSRKKREIYEVKPAGQDTNPWLIAIICLVAGWCLAFDMFHPEYSPDSSLSIPSIYR